MKKLLSADFARLFRSRLFLLCIIFSGGYAVFAVVMRYLSMSKGGYSTADGLLPLSILYGPIIWSLFIGLFIGTEFTDGAIRNKLVVGHTRLHIYLSNLLVSVTAALLMHLAFTLCLLGMSALLLEPLKTELSGLVVQQALSICITLASCALFYCITMLISSKATGSVAAILLSIALLMGSLSVYSTMTEPEYYDPRYYVNDSGQVVEVPAEKNPYYPSEEKRQICQLLLNLSPSGQAIQIARAEDVPKNAWEYPIYALSLSLLVTFGGALGFRRKNLR